MARTVVSLTDAKIKSAISKQKKSPEKIIKLADGGGLFLLLDKKGGTYWRFDYFRPITKKRTTIGIGVYSNLSLADARKFREEYKELLAQDIDPFAHRKEQEEQARFAMRNTFEAVAREFMQTEVVAESTRHRNEFIYQYLLMLLVKSQFMKYQPASCSTFARFMKNKVSLKQQDVCDQKQGKCLNTV